MMFSGDLIEKAVEGDTLLSVVCGASEAEGSGEGELETGAGVRGMRMKGTDILHMRPEATERTGLKR